MSKQSKLLPIKANKKITGRTIMRAEPFGQLVTKLWNPSATYSGLDYSSVAFLWSNSSALLFALTDSSAVFVFAPHVMISW